MSEGIDPELFSTVCFERDAAEKRVRELREAITKALDYLEIQGDAKAARFVLHNAEENK